MKSLILVLLVTITYSQDYTIAPDGTYVAGDKWTIAPDGTYVGGDEWVITPDGSYVGKDDDGVEDD